MEATVLFPSNEGIVRAAVCTRYGPLEVVEVRDVPTPKDDGILVRVHATTVTSGDCRVRGSHFPGGFLVPDRLLVGLRRPRKPILGGDTAGTVEAVGKRVTGFEKGDAAVASAWFGAHAEYVSVPKKTAIVKRPQKLSFEEAAALPFGAVTALLFLRDLDLEAAGKEIHPGDRLRPQGGARLPSRSCGHGQIQGRHRPTVSAGTDRRGAPLRRRGAQEGKRRHQRGSLGRGGPPAQADSRWRRPVL